MRRHRSRLAAATVFGLAVGVVPAAHGQRTYDPRFTPSSPGYYEATQPAPDVNRLVHEMGERVRHLSEDVASDLGRTPEGRHLLDDTRALARDVDRLHDTLHERPDPRLVARSYRRLDESWHHLRTMFEQTGWTQSVARAARRVDAVDAELHQAFGWTAYSGAPTAVATAPPVVVERRRMVRRPTVASAVLPLADQVLATTDTFIVRFAPTANQVPEGRAFLADAQRLRYIANDFREAAAQGAPADQLAGIHAAMDQTVGSLVWRTERISRGRSGPNIEAIRGIGALTQQIGAIVNGGGPAYGAPAGYGADGHRDHDH